jgi:hypothetical protein
MILVQNCDAHQLPLRDLRGRFGVVPQSPVLFSGSIRENLDPWGAATDEQLASALQVWIGPCTRSVQDSVCCFRTCDGACERALPVWKDMKELWRGWPFLPFFLFLM